MNIIRIGDTVGGVIVGSGTPTVLINGRPCATMMDTILPHRPPTKRPNPHQFPTKLVGGNPTVLVQGQIIQTSTRSRSTCTHGATTFSTNVVA